MGRYVYHFGAGKADGKAEMNELLGAKGANLAEMCRLGIAVPPGITITTEACAHYLRSGNHPPGLRQEVEEGIAHIETMTGRRFGDKKSPLLLSVRSGAPESMPGMMETILNVGLNDGTTRGLAGTDGDERFAFACRRRLVEMYSKVIFGLTDRALKRAIAQQQQQSDIADESPEEQFEAVRRAALREVNNEVPTTVGDQLWAAIEAIFESWNAPRARAYRRLHGIESGPGTGVTLMAMVFGNRDRQSMSGVAFSRHPVTGRNVPYGEFLRCAQGDQLVEGRITPGLLHEERRRSGSVATMREEMPEIYDQCCRVLAQLEAHYGDMQEVEFAVDSGKLWFLQTRQATRTGPAAVRAALDMIDEGLIDDEEAVLRVDANRHIPELMSPRLNPSSKAANEPAFYGMAASPGAATGRLVTSTAEALTRARRGESVVLVLPTTSVDDVDALDAVQAVVTTQGGITAHAAEVTREIGLPCVCGADEVEFRSDRSGIGIGEDFISRGEIVTVDGTQGAVYVGKLELLSKGDEDDDVAQFLAIADRYRRMDVRVDADSIDAIEQGMSAGADGVGMCRTESMVLSDRERVMAMRKFLLTGDETAADEAMSTLLTYHRHDVAQILRAVKGEPVALRLLDAPLADFLPVDEADIRATAQELEIDVDDVIQRTDALEESIPRLGLRGSRLAVVEPAIYTMQVQAIIEAARLVVDDGIFPAVEILIPGISDAGELEWVVDLIETAIATNLHGGVEQVAVELGILVQSPRAAMIAEAIALHADFITLATRELTQLCWGMSAESSRRIMTHYVDQGFVAADPYESVDRQGVGELLQMAVRRGRSRGAELMVGVDAGHSRDRRSVRFFEALDIDFLTVASSDVPTARLAAAQAYIEYERALQRRTRRGLED